MQPAESPVECPPDVVALAWSTIPADAIATLSVRSEIELVGGTALTVVRELVDGADVVLAATRDLEIPFPDEDAAAAGLASAKIVGGGIVLSARALAALGPAVASARLTAAVDRLHAEERAAEERAAASAARGAVLAATVEAFPCDGEDGPAIELWRGDGNQPLAVVEFDEDWERDRLWDWMRWTCGRFGEFADLVRDHGATALRSRLLREMVETEKAAKAAGLATSGRRPLRFWCGEVA